MKKVLLTGFGPFLQNKENPSEKICHVLSREFSDFRFLVLPVEYEKAFHILKNEAEKYEPDFIIMMGLAAKRSLISLEKVALNWIESDHPDGIGSVIQAEKIDRRDEQLAYLTTFPVNDLYQVLKQKGYPIEISFSAGAYVCNNLFYKTLRGFEKIPSLFVHLPEESFVSLPEQVGVIKDILVYCVRSN